MAMIHSSNAVDFFFAIWGTKFNVSRSLVIASLAEAVPCGEWRSRISSASTMRLW